MARYKNQRKEQNISIFEKNSADIIVFNQKITFRQPVFAI